MNEKRENEPTLTKKRTTVERKSDRELVVSRTFHCSARILWEAWTTSELFQQWWVPKSLGMPLLSCELDVRVGGTYRLVFAGAERLAFFGRYLEVTPPTRLVWSNDESGDAGAITTVTFTENGAETLLVVHDLYPSQEALEAALGSYDGMQETLDQLDELLVTLGAHAGRS